jgi:hypothetical protein
MAFFSEVKASLGLDIAPFEKGLAQSIAAAKQAQQQITKEMASQAQAVNREMTAAQNANRKSAQESASVFEEMFAAEQAAAKQIIEDEKAIAAAKRARIEEGRTLVMRDIANEQSARRRMIDSVSRGIKTLAIAAGLNMQGIAQGIARFVTGFSKEQEKSLDDLVSKTETAASKVEGNLATAQQRDAALREELAQKEEEKRVSRLSDAERENELIAERDRKRQEGMGRGTNAVRARLRVLEIEKELEQILDRKIAKQVKADEAALAAEEKKQKDVEDNLTSFFSDLDKAADVANEAAKKQAEADEKRTDELKDQAKTLLDQKKTIEQTLAAQEKGKRASLQDAASGKRKVGGATQANARRLLAANDEELRRMDAVSQAEDSLAGATTDSGRAAAKKELDARKAALAATQGRKASLEKILGGKVSDDFGKQQVEELKAVNTQLGKVNTALAPASIKSNK